MNDVTQIQPANSNPAPIIPQPDRFLPIWLIEASLLAVALTYYFLIGAG